jgi:hypothetical protein
MNLMLLIYLYLFVALLSLLAPIPVVVVSSRLRRILHSAWLPRSFPAALGFTRSFSLGLVLDPRSGSRVLGCCCAEVFVCSWGSPAALLGPASALASRFLSPVLYSPHSRWHPGFGRPDSDLFRGARSALFSGLRPRSSHIPHFPPPIDLFPALPASLRGSVTPPLAMAPQFLSVASWFFAPLASARFRYLCSLRSSVLIRSPLAPVDRHLSAPPRRSLQPVRSSRALVLVEGLLFVGFLFLVSYSC